MAQEAEEKKQMGDSESSPQMSEMTNAESDVTSGEEESTMGAIEGTSNLRRRTSRFKSVDSRNLLDEIPVGKKQEDNNSSSVGRVEVNSNTKFTLRPSSPAHRKIKESPLSSDAIFHQYGLLIRTGFWFSSKSIKDWPLLMCGLSLPIFPLLALMVEKLKIHTPASEGFVAFLYLIITTAGILYPGYVIHRVQSAMLSGLTLILIAVTGWMKLVSYAHTNADVRALKKAGEELDTPQGAAKVDYPDNINIKNLTYFMVAPTLCYQLSYPRSDMIRKGWVVRQVGKLLVFVGLMGFITEQYINPTVKNSQHPLKGNYLYALERILKLSIPTLYVWLCMFYCFFHLWLNIVAEVLRFGDREFYKDWWNAKTVEEYWRMWNMPVHRWMVRHIYFPCIRVGIPKLAAVIIVFAISGLFHEVAIGVPCHMLRCWAFLGIMLQVPLVFLTNRIQERYQNSMVGNMVFWFFFCIVGQPMCVLLYYHDVVNNFPNT